MPFGSIGAVAFHVLGVFDLPFHNNHILVLSFLLWRFFRWAFMLVFLHEIHFYLVFRKWFLILEVLNFILQLKELSFMVYSSNSMIYHLEIVVLKISSGSSACLPTSYKELLSIKFPILIVTEITDMLIISIRSDIGFSVLSYIFFYLIILLLNLVHK